MKAILPVAILLLAVISAAASGWSGNNGSDLLTEIEDAPTASLCDLKAKLAGVKDRLSSADVVANVEGILRKVDERLARASEDCEDDKDSDAAKEESDEEVEKHVPSDHEKDDTFFADGV